MLHDDRGVGHERPKLIRLKTRVPLQVVKKRLFVGVIVGNC